MDRQAVPAGEPAACPVRIRQVRPEFFTDAVVSSLPADVRLTYIGLWCVADDAGWLVWDVQQVAAQLYPYESIRVRTKRVERAGAALVAAGRMSLPGCGCAFIPKLPAHQKIGGNKSFTVRDKHPVHTSLDESARNVRVGNVRVGNVNTGASANDDDDRLRLLDAYRRQGLPVDGVG
jgi:hypothetical protein